MSATTASALKALTPSETALNMAVRSAQFVGLYAAFSMLHPKYTVPLADKRAAPTVKLEYGA